MLVCLKYEIIWNIYGGKDAGKMWFLHLKQRLEKVSFAQSKFDDCVFYEGKMIYVVYTDDSILAGPDQSKIDKTVEECSTLVWIRPKENWMTFWV